MNRLQYIELTIKSKGTWPENREVEIAFLTLMEACDSKTPWDPFNLGQAFPSALESVTAFIATLRDPRFENVTVHLEGGKTAEAILASFDRAGWHTDPALCDQVRANFEAACSVEVVG